MKNRLLLLQLGYGLLLIGCTPKPLVESYSEAKREYTLDTLQVKVTERTRDGKQIFYDSTAYWNDRIISKTRNGKVVKSLSEL